ncbi:MAG: VWA domain-containing protein [Acidimicrobiales bacterium]|jgi:Ca-activated chloride channel family protein
MTFIWPLALLFGLVVPVLLGVYLLAMRRRRSKAVTYSSVALLRSALAPQLRWRRHLPVALLFVSLALLAVAAARPQITSDVPFGHSTVVLALDESGSMCSTDVAPNRIAAAQKAARKFVDSLPSTTLAGLVEFNGFAEIAVAPTTERTGLDQAIENLSVGPGTAIGSAILEALEAIAEVDPEVKPVANDIADNPLEPGSSSTGDGTPGTPTKPGKDGYVPDVIVLLTDGANNRGITPFQAVPYAVARRVRVYTIGFGTTHPGPLECTPQQMAGELVGGFAGGFTGGAYGRSFRFAPGVPNPLVADLPPLRQVSQFTGGVSYSAQDEPQLAKVFASLPKEIGVQKERHEITWFFAFLGALLALAAATASLRWAPYP